MKTAFNYFIELFLSMIHSIVSKEDDGSGRECLVSSKLEVTVNAEEEEEVLYAALVYIKQILILIFSPVFLGKFLSVIQCYIECCGDSFFHSHLNVLSCL